MPRRKETGSGKATQSVPKGHRPIAAPLPHPSPSADSTALPQGQGPISSLGDICGALMRAQRDRVFAIVMQSRCDRAVEAYIRIRLGYRTVDDEGNPAPEAERKKLSALAVRIKAAVENGEDAPAGTEALAASVAMIVERNKIGRAVWDEFRAITEKNMIVLAKQLPVWPFVESVKGVSALGLAVIVGEAGDLGGYPKKGHLWKRLGMAVLDGKRQGNPGAGATAEDWIAHGYKKQRRAQIWAMLDDVMLRQQWAGDKDEDGENPRESGKPVAVPAHALGLYGEYYGRKKAFYIAMNEQRAYAAQAAEMLAASKRKGDRFDKKSRETLEAGRILPKHIDNRARRYMAKMFLRDLWKAWRGAKRAMPQGQTPAAFLPLPEAAE